MRFWSKSGDFGGKKCRFGDLGADFGVKMAILGGQKVPILVGKNADLGPKMAILGVLGRDFGAKSSDFGTKSADLGGFGVILW